MARLAKNTTPAERRRGCSWADSFQSKAEVQANGGQVASLPTFIQGNGVTLDGNDDYLFYYLLGTEFDCDYIGIVVVFTPHFDTDEDTGRCLFSAGTDDYAIIKTNNADSNKLYIILGNTTVEALAEATYSPYWLPNERNVLVITGTSGNTNVWLNGNSILANDTTAWSPTVVTAMNVGTVSGLGSYFDGIIHSLKIFKNAELTEGEAESFYNNDVYGYMDKATALYQMRIEDFDYTGGEILDSTDNGYDLDISGNPTKLPTRGWALTYTGPDYFQRTDSGAFDPAGSFSAAIVFRNTLASNAILIGKHLVTGDERSWNLYSGTTGAASISVSDDGTSDAGHMSTLNKASCVEANKLNCLVGTYEYISDPNCIAKLYLNDLLVSNDASFDGPPHNSTGDFQIGAQDGGGNSLDGVIYYAAFWDGLVLTHLQINDFKMRMRKSLKQV